MKKETPFNITAEMRHALKREILARMKQDSLTFHQMRDGNKNPFPVNSMYLARICREPRPKVGALTVLKLFEFFGYELKSFIFIKKTT